jgi:hypothetical protein
VDRSLSALSVQEQRTCDTTIKTPAVIEDHVCVAHCWAKAVTEIDPAQPPADVPLRRWAQLIDDIIRFIESGLDMKAVALGWTAIDLFGCDREKPFARIDRQGLCWLIAGNRIVDLYRSGAVIETWTGARQTWRRKPSEPDRVLLWELKA